MEPNPQLEASSVLAWTLINGFVNEYNKPIEFTNHRFFIDYLSDTADVIVSKKAAQVGATTMESLRNFHTAGYGKKNIIHTLQTSDVIKGFVTPKVNPIIRYNPKISELLSQDSESLKQFGENFIFYRGAQSESQAINITADVLCVDEYDRSNQKIVEMYQSRLDASPYKWRRYFSNPSAIGFGVDGLYQKSDQRHWMVTCKHCGHASYLDFAQGSEVDNHYCDLELSIFVCGKCHGEIYDKDRINGSWVAKYPDKAWHGYWFSQMMAPWMSAPHIIEKQQMNSIEYFHNFVLGKAYTPTDLIVSRETILNATEPKQIPKLRVAIGVDVGHTKHWVAGTPEGIFDLGKTESWEEIEKIFLMYGGAVMVIDAMPDFTIPKQLMEKYKGRVFICYYKQDTQNAGAVRFKTGQDYGIVHADRTKIFDLVATEINNKLLKFRTEPTRLEEYIVHWGNTFRTTTMDKNGFERPIWTKDPSKPEHFCLDGDTRIKTLRGDLPIKDVCVGDYALTRKGYRPVTRAWMTKRNAVVKKYRFANGAELIATPDHKVATQRGFQPLQALVYSDKIKTWSKSIQLLSKALYTVDTQIQKTGLRGSISRLAAAQLKAEKNAIIRTSGLTTTALYLTDMPSITKTMTRSITASTTWSSSRVANTNSIMYSSDFKTLSTGGGIWNTWTPSVLNLTTGSKPIRVKNICKAMRARLLNLMNRGTLRALAAVQRLLRSGLAVANGVHGPVSIEPTPEEAERRNVYNLTVDGEHEFYANGILVSNCHSTIYMRIALSRQIGRGFGMDFAEPSLTTKPQTAQYVTNGQMAFDLSAQIREAMES